MSVAPVQLEQRLAQVFGHAAGLHMLVADHVAGEERQHGPDLAARDIAVVAAIERGDLPNLDLLRRAAGVLGSVQDMRLRRADVVGAQSEERRVGKECRSRWSPY